MTNFVRIVNATGVIDGWGDMSVSQIPMQAREGMTILECGQDTVQRDIIDGRTSIFVDLDWLKNALRALVDSNAGIFRAQFVTDVYGQSQAYQKKESEANLWVNGDDELHPEKYPFLIAEAQARNLSVADVCSGILARVAEVTPVLANIEAQRIAAKENITASISIPNAMAASQVDWQSVF